MTSTIAVRALMPDEWAAFRDVRLGALRLAPGVYSDTLANASQRTEPQWRELIAGAHHQVFGLFDADVLVGITGVFRDRDDPSDQTALLAMSFIEPTHRGRGFSKLFYDVRLDWARSHGGIKRAVISHRSSNVASMRANQRYGFRRTGAAPRTWPDGQVEDEIFYELIL